MHNACNVRGRYSNSGSNVLRNLATSSPCVPNAMQDACALQNGDLSNEKTWRGCRRDLSQDHENAMQQPGKHKSEEHTVFTPVMNLLPTFVLENSNHKIFGSHPDTANTAWSKWIWNAGDAEMNYPLYRRISNTVKLQWEYIAKNMIIPNKNSSHYWHIKLQMARKLRTPTQKKFSSAAHVQLYLPHNWAAGGFWSRHSCLFNNFFLSN